MKYLQVTMPDGSKWNVPAKIIAENRADYYGKKEPPYKKTFKEEFAHAMSDPEDLIDWAANNMNWSDVESVAKLSEDANPIDFQEGWCNGEKEVIEVDGD